MRLIAYTSHTTSAWTDAELARLVEVAAGRNRALEVTGRLFYLNRRFFQVLEGPPDGVRAAMATIRGDLRHGQIIVLLDTAIEHRSASGTPMEFVSEERISWARTFALDEPEVTGTAPDNLLSLLRESGVGNLYPAMTNAPRQDRAVRTVEGFLAAARIVAIRNGIAAVTIKTVAEQAHMPIASAYRYFASPDDLFRVMARQRQLRQLRELRGWLEQSTRRSGTELASGVAFRVARKYVPAPDLDESLRIPLLREYHEIAFDDLWQLAPLLHRTLPGAGRAGAGTAARTLTAVALAGMLSASKMAALFDPDRLHTDAFVNGLAARLLTTLA